MVKKRGVPLFEMDNPEDFKRYDAYVKTGELANDQKMLFDFTGWIRIDEHEAEMEKLEHT